MPAIADTQGMDDSSSTFLSVAEFLQAHRPADPVYCVFPHEYAENTKRFVDGFPGRVLYAIKANDYPQAMAPIVEGGVRHFDCASLPEIETVNRHCTDATSYFMTPVRIRGTAAAAQSQFGVRHFLVDHATGIPLLANEIDMPNSVVFARMAVSHESAMANLSKRFGAPPDDIPGIIESIAESGAEPALAFNVGSSVTSPDAYSHSLDITNAVLERLPVKIRLLDIGGGFPKGYPGFPVPPLDDYFSRIAQDIESLPLAENAEILAEPGRALAAPGMSAIAEVCLRKENRLFLNDGMYGIFWELRFKGHERYPVKTWRDGQPLEGDPQTFRLFGPTCDSLDELPGDVELPADIRPGDHLEFGNIGAYSLSGRTSFNGFYSEQIITITEGRPPQ